MNVATVMDFLRDELDRHGADLISTTDLSALATVDRTLDGFGLPDANLARAVAWTASLTPHADPVRFEAAFGQQGATLFRTLVPEGSFRPIPTPNPGGLGRLLIRTTWAKATAQGDPQVQAIATALLAAEVRKTSDADDRAQLLGLVDIAVGRAPDETIASALTAIREGLAAPEAGGAPPAMETGPTRLISLSIDVVGSTQAKRRLRDLAMDEARRRQLYEGFYAEFLREEDRFYADLFAPEVHGNGAPLDWRRLFVVKGIGDEIWLIYDASPPNGVDADTALRQAAARLISAAMSLVERNVSCGGTGEDTGPGFDSAVEDRQVVDWMHLPFKVTMDLVEDAIEISAQRLEHFAGRVGSYLAPPHSDTGPGRPGLFGDSHVDLLRRINAGHFELAGGHRVRQAYRTDFIGPDIDRFFRITKFALPGLVMVGDDLMRALRLNVEETYGDVPLEPATGGDAAPSPPTYDRVRMTFPSDLHRPDSDVLFRGPQLRRLRPIGRAELKGIDAAYAVHHLVCIPSFRALVNGAASNTFLTETIAAFPEFLRVRIAPNADGSPSDDRAGEA